MPTTILMLSQPTFESRQKNLSKDDYRSSMSSTSFFSELHKFSRRIQLNMPELSYFRLKKRWGICAAILAPFLIALPAHAETLTDVWAVTLKEHPTLLANAATVKAAEEGLATVRSGYFPTISADSQLNSDNFWRPAGRLGLFGRQLGIQAEQMVFDGFITRSRVESSQAEHDALVADRRQNANTLMMDVARAYMNVTRDRDLLAAARRNLDEHHRSVSRLVAIIKFDSGKNFDLIQVRAREAYAGSLVAQAESQVESSEGLFKELVGRAPGDLAAPPFLSGKGFGSLQEALEVGQAEHPAIRAEALRKEGRHAQAAEAKGQLSPHIDLTARYVKAVDVQALPGQNDEGFAGTRISFAFPTGGALLSNIRNAELLEEAADDKVAAAKRDVREALRQAWAQRQGLINMMPLVNEHVIRSNAVLQGFKTQYTIGRRTVLDLLIVQNDAYQAETRKLSLASDRLMADYTLAGREGILVARFAPPQ